jgi:hypothetical protein
MERFIGAFGLSGEGGGLDMIGHEIVLYFLEEERHMLAP